MHVKQGHDDSDVGIRGIIVFAAFLVIGGIVSFIAAGLLIKGLEHWEASHEPKPTAVQAELQKNRGLVAQPRMNQYPGQEEHRAAASADEVERARTERSVEATFPTPRLQYDDVYEMNTFLKSENDWLDQAGRTPDGSIHIPIRDAINVLAQRGLPAVNGTFSPEAPVGVPTGESRAGSHVEKLGKAVHGH